MPLEKDFTLTQIRYPARDLLKELAYKRRKPMYEVLEDLIRDAFEREGAPALVGSMSDGNT